MSDGGYDENKKLSPGRGRCCQAREASGDVDISCV